MQICEESTIEQQDVIREVTQGEIDDFEAIPGKKLHEYMVSETAYTDRYHLVFIDSSERERAKFLYYMGAENEA